MHSPITYLYVCVSNRGFIDEYKDAMASAKERWSIPNDLVFRLGVKVRLSFLFPQISLTPLAEERRTRLPR